MRGVADNLFQCLIISQFLTGLFLVVVLNSLDTGHHAGGIDLHPPLTDGVRECLVLLWCVLLQMVSDLMHEDVSDIALCCFVGVQVDRAVDVHSIEVRMFDAIIVYDGIDEVDVDVQVVCDLGKGLKRTALYNLTFSPIECFTCRHAVRFCGLRDFFADLDI